jgi:hypothetical protein
LALLTKYYSAEEIKENETDGANGMYTGDETCIQSSDEETGRKEPLWMTKA